MPVPPIRFSYVSGDGQQIAAYRWDPPGPPVAAMQLTRGMGEQAQAGSWPGTARQ